jgi:hypothetical protein
VANATEPERPDEEADRDPGEDRSDNDYEDHLAS